MSTIDELMKEYQMWITKANDFEVQHKMAIQNAESVQRVIKLMKERLGLPVSQDDKVQPLKPSSKYENMNMTAAIFDILKNEKNLLTDEIYQRLVSAGYKSKSQTLKKDVATKLSVMKKQGNIGCDENERPLRFYLIEEKPTRKRRTI